MQVKISQAIEMITSYILAKLVPMLEGSPGMGKSQIVHQIAREYNLKVIDVRLAQCDPTDLMGFPSIQGKKAGYVPMETFPIEGDPIPENYSGWLIFFDEFNSAGNAVQAAAYKIILDRMVGLHKLHKNVAMVCAGNKETDGAIVNPMSTALQSRLVHMELVVDHNEWCDWGAENGIDHRITDYVRTKPGMVYTFTPDHTDKTYACPRTWEFANRILKTVEFNSPNMLQLLAGTISEGVAREFLTFCRIYDQIPKPAELMANPETIPIPQEPSILYALTGTISHNATDANFTRLMKFVKRMPSEFQVFTLRDTIRRNKSMMGHEAVRDWIAQSSVALF